MAAVKRKKKKKKVALPEVQIPDVVPHICNSSSRGPVPSSDLHRHTSSAQTHADKTPIHKNI